MKYSLILFLLVGQAWGQDKITTLRECWITPVSNSQATFNSTEHVHIVCTEPLQEGTPPTGSVPAQIESRPDCNSVNADGLSTAMYCGPLPVSRPEPIDVPAIQEKRPVVQYHTDCPPLPDGTHGPKGDLCYVEPLFETHWTCRDKSRIKLTAEDGKVWCHKPQVQP